MDVNSGYLVLHCILPTWETKIDDLKDKGLFDFQLQVIALYIFCGVWQPISELQPQFAIYAECNIRWRNWWDNEWKAYLKPRKINK